MPNTVIISVFLTSLIHPFALGSVLVFQSTPSTVINGLTEEVRLRCSLNDTAASSSIVGKRDVTRTPDNVLQVGSIIITANGQDVASVSSSNVAKYLANDVNVNVTGDVSRSSGERGFVEMTIKYPTQAQLGEYACEVTAVKMNGRGAIFDGSTEINSSQPTIMDLVNEIHVAKVRDQQQQTHIVTQQQTIMSLQSQIHADETKEQQQQTVITNQQQTITSLQSQIHAVETKEQQQHTVITTQQQTITSLQSQIHAVETKEQQQQTVITTQQQTITSLQTSATCLKTRHTNPEVRLVGGDGCSFGAVQVTHGGKTAMLCDDSFGIQNNGAKVVCRMLGFSHGVYEDGNHFTTMTSVTYLLDDLTCTGSEAGIDDCSHATWGSDNCGDTEIAGVWCSKT